MRLLQSHGVRAFPGTWGLLTCVPTHAMGNPEDAQRHTWRRTGLETASGHACYWVSDTLGRSIGPVPIVAARTSCDSSGRRASAGNEGRESATPCLAPDSRA